MTYADSTLVREMCGNPNTTDVNPTSITQAIAYGDSLVNTFTGYDVWSSINNPDQYTTIQTASTMFAASYIIEFYPKRSQEARDLYNAAIDICINIFKNGAHGAIVVGMNWHRSHWKRHSLALKHVFYL